MNENLEISNAFDLVIIGTGGAGISAAMEAHKKGISTLLISKGNFNDSKTARAQGGIQAAIYKEDSPDIHLEDTLKAGKYKNNRNLVKILTQSAKPTIDWLVNIGVEFDREGENFKLKNAAGLTFPRVLSCGDSTGNKIINPLKKQVQALNIPVWEMTAVTKIEKIDNRKFHLKLLQKDNKVLSLNCKSVIIATGGIFPKEKKAGLVQKVGGFEVPDGIELAKQIGAKIESPNLMQYHPTGVIQPKKLRRERLPETMRGAGARLFNKDGKEFANALTTRNDLTQLIVEECKQGRGVKTSDGRVGVWLNTPDIDQINGDGYLEKTFPKFYNLFLEEKHNLNKTPVLIYPIVHYSLGGICIDANAETSVKGVFAAGETTYGVHGEDRLMGNSLLDIFVFGRIAGKSASDYINEKRN